MNDRTTTTPMPGASPHASTSRILGTLLARLIVPLWVLAGALFKLFEQNPGNLPSVIRDASKSLGFENLDRLMQILIGCELFAAGVMLLLPRFARAMAIFMLSCFCLILIAQIYTGATSCGCFGKLPVQPWQMLIIDGLLLTMTLIFRPQRAATPGTMGGAKPGLSTGGSLAAAAGIAVVGMGIAFVFPKPADKQQQVADIHAPIEPHTTQPQQLPTTATAPDSTQASAPATPPQPATSPASAPPTPAVTDVPPTVNPAPRALPSSWYTQEMDKWIGKPWREVDIFQLMPTWPRDMDTGMRYIVFYRRTCEHCEMMLSELLKPLDGLLTLVEVPESPTELRSPSAWALPLTVEPVLHPEHMSMPLGPNWIVTTPLVVTVSNGIVTCAQEGDHKKCLGVK